MADLLVFGAALSALWHSPWAHVAPANSPTAQITRSPAALPAYAAYSLLRLAIAYALSLVFALVYGYVAAYHEKAERVMLPLLDIVCNQFQCLVSARRDAGDGVPLSSQPGRRSSLARSCLSSPARRGI